jgi:hypothetical protein
MPHRKRFYMRAVRAYQYYDTKHKYNSLLL